MADRPVGAGPDAGRRVTLGVVLHRPGHVTPQLRQVGRQLQNSVDGAHEHLARPAVDGEVSEGGVERPVHRPARRRRGGKGRGGGGGQERGGQEEEGEEEEEEGRGKRGGGGGGEHGGQREEGEKEEEERMEERRRKGGEEE